MSPPTRGHDIWRRPDLIAFGDRGRGVPRGLRVSFRRAPFARGSNRSRRHALFERFDLLFERFPLCKQRAVPGIRHFAHNFSYDGNVDSTKVGHGRSWLKTTAIKAWAVRVQGALPAFAEAGDLKRAAPPGSDRSSV